MKSFKMVIVTFIILVCVSACQPAIPHNLPDRDIIYQAGAYKLGFVDADGRSNQVFDLKQQFTSPVWSADGQYLYGLSKGKGLSIGYPAVWDMPKKRLMVCDWNQPNYMQIQGYFLPENPYMVIVQHTEAIILFDIATCKQKQFLVDYSGQANYDISGFSYSQARQELVYGLVVDPYGDRQYRLMLKNLKNGDEAQLAEGINPNWSPDGNQTAFVGLDGLYVISFTDHTHEIIRLTDEPLFDPWSTGPPWVGAPKPTWSPDGLWLVYHHRISERSSTGEHAFIIISHLYTININERIPETILEGGYYPSWHP